MKYRVIIFTLLLSFGSLVDVEIAGRRTMIRHRSGLYVHRMTVGAEHTTISNLCLTPL